MSTTNNVQETLINNLIILRKARGLTQIELGDKINYSDKTISKWEKGDSCPNIEAVYKIAKFYGVTVDDLLSEDLQQEHGASAQRQVSYSKVIISLLAVIAVWVIATIIFAVGLLKSLEMPWLVFVLATPASALVALVFNSMWGNTRYNYLIISILLWTLLTSIFLSALEYVSVLWVIFLIGIPIQVAIILWSQLKYQKRKRNRDAKEEADTEAEGAFFEKSVEENRS